MADGRVTVTPLATTLHEKTAAMRGGVFSIVRNALRLLNSPRTRLPAVDTTAGTAFVTEAFMEPAYR